MHAAPAPASAATPRPTVKAGRLHVILSNLIVVRELLEFDYLHLALAAFVAAGFMGLSRGPSSASGARYLWGFATVALYAIGYLPLSGHGRAATTGRWPVSSWC